MPRKRKAPTWTWSGVVTVLVPLSTLALVLLGYGYTLAVQSVFGIDAGLVAHSLPAYLQLSSHVVVHLLSAVSEAVQRWPTYSRLYAGMLPWMWVSLPVWALVFLMWLPRKWWCQRFVNLRAAVGRSVATYRRWEPHLLTSRREKLAGFVGQCVSPLRAWLKGFACAPQAVWWAFGSLALILGWPILSLGLAVVVVMLIGYLFSLLPFIGLGVGQSALQHWVVAPTTCVSVRSRDQFLVDQLPLPSKTEVATGAHCVCLEKDGKEVARGRLVVSTAEAAILFDPITGRTQRIPVDGVTIQSLSSLD